MIGRLFRIIILVFACQSLYGQTTDLSIVAQAQNSSSNPVSQVEIFQDFQYIVTIINSGNAVANATFEITMDDDLTNLDLNTISSQNNLGGASNASNLQLNGSTLTGAITNLPNDSSVELKIEVTAPSQVGGIAINAIILPPSGTTDINNSNNQSLISIDVIDVDIDFLITHTQVSPAEGTPIPAWNSMVTYQFTITNNSAIDFPLTEINGGLTLLSDFDHGRPNVRLESIECIATTNGTECPDVSGLAPGTPNLISTTTTMFTISSENVFTSGGSVTFEIVYEYVDPSCGLELEPISVASVINIALNHSNSSPNQSEPVLTELPEAFLCLETDICIDTIQIDPDPTTIVNWNQEVTFETTVCNNGPINADIAFFIQNLSPLIDWEILSVNCTQTTGTIDCDDVSINVDELFWVSDTFNLPVGATVTITTIVVFLEPECSSNTDTNMAHIRSGTNVLEPNVFDPNIQNSTQTDFVMLPATDACPNIDLEVIKTQINPALPLGSSADNTIQEGTVTYEITVSNLSNSDTLIELKDYTENVGSVGYTGILTAIECVSTTGGATCFDINSANIDVALDGEPQGGEPDIFWEITAADNWNLPGNSSVTFHATIDWQTECSIEAIPVFNLVEVNHATSSIDNNPINNEADVSTFIAPCVDLVVQTFPEFTQVNINQEFDWIIDITNSENSSNAINIFFENTINEVFTINGTASCVVTNGNATCISDLAINNNMITGTIDNMDASSTIQIRIPVIAPSFGGAYNNIAVATPNEDDNREVSPETNTSISNIQVVAPVLQKFYNPSTITVGEESVLTFTVTNLSSNPAQTNIAFVDTFSSEIVVVSTPEWTTSNGCTATFLGNSGDHFAGISDLVFPEGVSECTFSVIVTSNTPGVYVNDANNFSEQNNIDTSQTYATLTVLDDGSDVDIDVQKNVTPLEAHIGDYVTFQIIVTNLGTTQGNAIEILDMFPEGMAFISATTSAGDFNSTSFIWSINALDSNQSETLTIVAQVLSNTNLLNVAALSSLEQPDRDNTNNRDDAEVTVNFCLYIPKGFSPNNDGFNDEFSINCIENYPNNHIKIYNRLGVLVYETENYKNDWNGKPNKGFPTTSQLLPVGTYFYVLDLNNGDTPIVDWVYLNY